MSKQLLAKVGVFALIVVNLGAYYVFWPDNGSRGTGPEKTDGHSQPLQVAGSASAAQPADVWKPSITPKDTPPPGKAPEPLLVVPPKSATNDKKSTPDKDLPPIPDPLASEPKPLLFPPPMPAADKSDSAKPALKGGGEDPTIQLLKRAKDALDKGEPMTKGDPTTKGDPMTKAAPAPLLDPVLSGTPLPAPKEPAPARETVRPVLSENSPWTLLWESSDGHTTLTAKLNKRLEFRIVCERVKMESPDGVLLAIGKVTFSGPGLKGSCGKLTIMLSDDTLLLEGKAELQVQQGSLSDLAIPTVELKGEQLSLRLQQLTGGVNGSVTGVTPTPNSTTLNPTTPSPAPIVPIGAGGPSPFSPPGPITPPRKMP